MLPRCATATLPARVQALEVLGLAYAGNHHILQLAQPCQGVKSHLQAPGFGVGHLGLTVGEIRGHAVGVVGTGHGGGVGVDGRRADDGIVGMRRGVLIGTPQVVGGAGAVIPRSNGHNDVREAMRS